MRSRPDPPCWGRSGAQRWMSGGTSTRSAGFLLLITGGAGFIGRAVVTAALSAGHDVRVLDRAPERVPDGAEPVGGDVRDPAVVAAALRGVDAVSHQAAKVGLGVDVGDLP